MNQIPANHDQSFAREMYRLLFRMWCRFRAGLIEVFRQADRLKHAGILRRSKSKNFRDLKVALKKAAGDCSARPVIVIGQFEHLGDIVASEPIIRQVRRENPAAFIVFALNRVYRELVETHPDVDHVLTLYCIKEWAYFSKLPVFSRVIDLNMEGRICLHCRFSWQRPDRGNGVTTENYFDHPNLLAVFSTLAGISAPNDGPILYPKPSDIAAIDELNLPERFICLHAGSNQASRAMPPDKWLFVVEHINKACGLPVVEIGHRDLVLHGDDKVNLNLCGRLSILQSAEVIRRSMIYLGTDSGPAHLANAMGTFGLILFGRFGRFEKYLPYSGNYGNGVNCSLIYHSDAVAEIPVIRITEAIDQALASLNLVRENRGFDRRVSTP